MSEHSSTHAVVVRLPEGSYWSAAEERYVLPFETDKWRPEEYERVTGRKLPPCPCGNVGGFVLFLTAYKIGAAEGRGQVTVLCDSCAEKAGDIAQQLDFDVGEEEG